MAKLRLSPVSSFGCVHCGRAASTSCTACGDPVCGRCKVIVVRQALCQVCSPATRPNEQVFYLGSRKRF